MPCARSSPKITEDDCPEPAAGAVPTDPIIAASESVRIFFGRIRPREISEVWRVGRRRGRTKEVGRLVASRRPRAKLITAKLRTPAALSFSPAARGSRGPASIAEGTSACCVLLGQTLRASWKFGRPTLAFLRGRARLPRYMRKGVRSRGVARDPYGNHALWSRIALLALFRSGSCKCL
jgi:hypothetical protein